MTFFFPSFTFGSKVFTVVADNAVFLLTDPFLRLFQNFIRWKAFVLVVNNTVKSKCERMCLQKSEFRL